MFHTRCQFLVLFGLPTLSPGETERIANVWNVLLSHLRLENWTGCLFGNWTGCLIASTQLKSMDHRFLFRISRYDFPRQK